MIFLKVLAVVLGLAFLLFGYFIYFEFAPQPPKHKKTNM